MTFAAPIWVAGAAALSVVVVVLHLLARRRPRPFVFPTVRFIPDQAASAPAAARIPSDLLLLLLRVVILLLIGAAFARPLRDPPRRTVHLVLIDRSRAVSRAPDDSASALLRQANLVIAFDSVPHEWKAGAVAGDTGGMASRGSLSTALLAALRRAPALAAGGDSLALHIISPFAAEEWDEATIAIRRRWQGHITIHAVPPREPISPRVGGSSLPSDDPLTATLALIGAEAHSGVRIVRGHPVPADSSWAAAGGVLINWPRAIAEGGWDPIPPDTAGGVFTEGRVVVAPFTRTVRPPAGAVVARWPDGTAAATEHRLGAGCERDVAIPTDLPGDFILRPGMQALTRELTAPCGGRTNLESVPASRLDSLRGGPALLATSALPPPPGGRVPANAWYLATALLLLAAEPLVRRVST